MLPHGKQQYILINKHEFTMCRVERVGDCEVSQEWLVEKQYSHHRPNVGPAWTRRWADLVALAVRQRGCGEDPAAALLRSAERRAAAVPRRFHVLPLWGR